MKPWTVPLFVVAAAFAPLALVFRYAVLTPLSLLIPPLRKIVVERYSGMIINRCFAARRLMAISAGCGPGRRAAPGPGRRC